MLRNLATKWLKFGVKPLFIPPAVRFFSSANKQVVKSTPKPAEALCQILVDEYKFEEEKYEGFPEDKEFIKESGFVVTDINDTTEIKLTKNVGDKVVEIIFQASEAFNDEEDPEMEKNVTEEKQSEGSKSRADFFLAVKAKDKSGLLFDCVSENVELRIYNVAYSKDIDSLIKENNTHKQETTYTGPNFEHLDEKLQSAFFDYIGSLGVNDKVLAFIECASAAKEQRLYMNWLQSMKNFVAEDKVNVTSS